MSGYITGAVFKALVYGVVLAVCSTDGSTSLGLQRLKRQSIPGGMCEIPEPLQNGKYKPSYRRCPPDNNSPACKLLTQAYVPPDWVLHFTCDSEYVLSTNMTVAVCMGSQWVPALPVCNRQSTPEKICKQLDSSSVCTKLSQCPKAQLDLKRGVGTMLCDVTGSEPSVCCEPQFIKLSVNPTGKVVVRKSPQKCQEYAKAVFDIGEEGGVNRVVGADTDTCGMTDSLITDVMDAQFGEFPHMVVIGHRIFNGMRWRCEGVLISERFILSTAFCAAKKSGLGSDQVLVRLGVEGVSGGDNDNDGLQEVEQVIVHPEYNSSYYNNIALFKLKKDVKFNEYVRPICLQADTTFGSGNVIATGLYTLAGESGSSIPKKINMTLVGGHECDQSYKDFRETFKNGITETTMICTKEVKRRDFSCGSYDGGALQIRLEKPYCMYSLVGILSYGRFCLKHLPWVYERVSAYVPWIESIVWP